MYSKSIIKTLVLVLCTGIALLFATATTASAQEFFGGRGIAGGSSGSPFSSQLAQQLQQPASNPLAGIFKKPAFLENLKLPSLGNLIPQKEAGSQTMLGKWKTKTDAFFSKALAFEKFIPGRQEKQASGGSAEWDSVRKSMEDILASRSEQNPLRSAGASGDTTRR